MRGEPDRNWAEALDSMDLAIERHHHVNRQLNTAVRSRGRADMATLEDVIEMIEAATVRLARIADRLDALAARP